MVVCVLAGGMGKRIGMRKALVKIFNRTLIEIAVDRARALSDTVVVSCGKFRIEGLPVEQVEDVKGEGPMAGIFSMLLRHPRVLFFPVDMPFLTVDVLKRLWDESWSSPVVVASAGGFLFPTVGVYSDSVVGIMEACIDSRRYSLKGFLDSVDGVKVVDFSDVDHVHRVFLNINTWEDLRVAEGWFKNGGCI